MKKSISILVAVIMILATLSVTAFATETKTDTLINKVSNSTEMQATVKSGSTLLGSSTTTYYVKGNSAAYEFNNGFLKVRVVLADGNAYAYFPSLPYFYAKLTNTGLINVDVSSLIKNAMGITNAVTVFEKSYDETVDGTTYYVEQYNDRAQAVLKFYYIGDDLKILKVTNRSGSLAESTQYTYFDNYSFSVDSSVVAAPKGINVTPLLKSLFTLLLSNAITL